jgi:hypothetical protein
LCQSNLNILLSNTARWKDHLISICLYLYRWRREITKVDQLLAFELAKYLDLYKFKNKDKVQS